jgi:hypothetical protein
MRWGVFVRDPEAGEWREWFRWDGDELVPLEDRLDAESRAQGYRKRHPDWQVEARQTDRPLPGTWSSAFAEWLS